MFRIVIAIVIITSGVWIYINLRRRNMTAVMLWMRIKKEFLVFKDFKDIEQGQIFITLRKVTYLLTVTFFLILTVSAYLQVLITGGPLTGWLLIVHVTVAPLFAICLMLTILLWAHRQRFNRQDWLSLQQIVKQKKISVIQSHDQGFWNKFNFWIFMLTAIPAILSIVFQLYPIFDSEGMEILLLIHRYSTLILFVVVVIHGRLLLQRLNN